MSKEKTVLRYIIKIYAYMQKRIKRPSFGLSKGGEWYARVLFELCQKKSSRFGELKRVIPEISNVVLTSALRGLEEKYFLV